MEINFRTKKESNRLQEEAFLKLDPAERFFEFLKLSEALKDFPSRTTIREKKNFVIHIHTKNDK